MFRHRTGARPRAPIPVAIQPRPKAVQPAVCRAASPHRHATHRSLRRAARAVAPFATVLLIVSVPAAAFADAGGTVVLAVNDLPTVIVNLRAWLVGISLTIATLYLVLSGVYWATAGGDPTQVEKAKATFKNALIGYGVAVLAPVLLQVVKGIVGG